MNRDAVLSSMHEKLSLIAPPFLSSLGLTVHNASVNTDVFGTFSGERKREGSPRVTAEKKARAAMALAGQPLGLASEGTIASSSFMPIISDHEIVLFVDDEEGFVVAESEVSYDIMTGHWVVTDFPPSLKDLVAAGFPEHGMIVHGSDVDGPIFKGIHSYDELEQAVSVCKNEGSSEIVVQSDFRAHHCPTRRPTINKAAQRLADRLQRTCPSCDCPGWGKVDILRGRCCSMCQRPTGNQIATIEGCARCEHRISTDFIEVPIEPLHCEFCNP